ncbi:zinc-binding dehydrogenase [Paracoccus sp. MBLB3053]|uniref:enoyl-[acyl-carrier-protein] reductase n=1 Tax=Paracoccus aurantius TaxID=3073814 RepID=A0ABU2HNP5_9RHOB|nr:zinc-binding dehydrogenase [Paracoccus sp. MBLB3053]MDS9466666.1 zinc-binding dehydrogenase [Paracoccus sp. MBLB3053]
MRSAIHSTFGEPAEVLSLGESPLPEPAEGQVRVRTILSPIHNHDLWTVRGNYGYKPELPAIGGSEAVGTVDALGAGVEGIAIGQRIAVAGVHGTWAEYFLAPAASLIPLPDAITDEQGAQIIAMPFSAITLIEFMGVEPGDWVIQNTANGAVGKAVAMLGAARGVNVISLVRRDAAISEMEALGIGHVISTETEGWQDRVREMTKGASIRAGVDSIGGKASGEMLGLLGEKALLVSFGNMTDGGMEISSGDLIFKQATVKGFWAAKVNETLPRADMARLMGELITQVAEGKLLLPVDGIYGLDQAREAVTASLTAGKSGKVLFRP